MGVQTLSAAYKKLDKPLLLTAAVAAGKWYASQAYEIAKIAEALDFIDLMSYDLHGSWERQAGIHTALFPRKGEQGANRELNVAVKMDKLKAEFAMLQTKVAEMRSELDDF